MSIIKDLDNFFESGMGIERHIYVYDTENPGVKKMDSGDCLMYLRECVGEEKLEIGELTLTEENSDRVLEAGNIFIVSHLKYLIFFIIPVSE